MDYIDIYAGNGYVVAKNYKPVWTCWRSSTVTKHVREHRRTQRRRYKQYLKTGRIEDFNRSQKKITKWDFD